MATMDRERQADNIPAAWEAVASALVSGVVLWAAWAFYSERLQATGAAWHDWIGPLVLALGGVLGLVAAALLALRRPSGREVLQVAGATIPLFLAVGLLFVPFRVAGEIAGRLSHGIALPAFGDLVERLRQSPPFIANIAIVALIILVAIVGQVTKPRATREDER